MIQAMPLRAQEFVQLPLEGSNKVVFRFVFRNGSVCDPAGKEGLTYLTTSLMAQGGTRTLSSTEITRKTYPWAVRIGSSTDKETSTITFEVLTRNLKEFYPILRDIIVAPGFREEDFTRVLSNQQNYVDEVIRQSSDEEFGKKILESVLFAKQPYASLTAGTTSGLKSITVKDVEDHYRKYFGVSNLMVGIAGNFSPDLVATLKRDLQQLTAEVKPADPGKSNQPEGLDITIVAKEGAMGSAISAGFPMDITRANDEFAALMVANSWLGEHRKSYSRLYQKIREARSMNYGDYTYIEWYENGGSNMLPPPGTPRSLNYFSIWLRPVQTAGSLKKQYPELSDLKVGHAPFALRMALREMQSLIKNGMSKEDFIETREFLKSYTKLYAQTPSRRLGYLMDSRFYGRKDWLSECGELLNKLSVADVNAAMSKYWQTDNLFVAIITDPEEATALQSLLLSGAESPMSYSDQMKATLSENIKQEDEEVKSYPLQTEKVKIIKSSDPFR
jgi:zinc protease